MNNIRQCNCIGCRTQSIPRWKTVGFKYKTENGHLYKIATMRLGDKERIVKSLIK